MSNHTSKDKGERKENKSGGCLTGLAYKILIPENGFKLISFIYLILVSIHKYT